MNNIVDFFKKKYKILIPIMVITVLIVTILIFYKEYQYANTRNKEEVSVFQYINAALIKYDAVVTYNLKKIIVDVTPKDKIIKNNVVPIYYDDLSKIVFPVEMSIVFPLRDGEQYKLYKYASYFNSDDVHFINNNDNELNIYDDFFLYNGKGGFFFPEKTVLKFNDKDYVELAAGSFVNIIGGYTLSYFDPVSETSEFIELNGRIATVVNEYFTVNISERYFQAFGTKVLLHLPNNLEPVFKTIDK